MHTYDTLEVGQSFTAERHLSFDDVRSFAEISGDDNPIHVDEEYARQTRFGRPVVHGVLLMGIVSKVLGRDFPGHGSIAVSISCRFLRPVPVDSTIMVEVKIAEKIEKRRHIRAKVYVYLDGKMAVGGEAVLIAPDPADVS